MIDLSEALTVAEYVKLHGYTKLWLCPHLVSNGKIGNPAWMAGYECSASTIPDEVKDRKVTKHFKENGVDCIIWYHEDDKSFLTSQP